MVSKKLTIKPDGNHVLGGSASYVADPSNGKIHYTCAVALSYMGTHNLTPQGDIQVDPKLLKSANAKVGMKIEFGLVTILVTKIEGKRAIADLTVKGWGGGQVVISLEKEVIEVVSIVGDVKYFWVKAHVEAV